MLSEVVRRGKADQPFYYSSYYRGTKTARRMVSGGPFYLVAGAGFEPATSGL